MRFGAQQLKRPELPDVMRPKTFQEIVIRDGRIAPHATAVHAAWLWSADGSAILWTNAAGAAAFGLEDRNRLGEPLGAFDPHRRQVAQLANRLPTSGATRLERMRGFGAAPGQLATCSCALLTLEDGSNAILIVSLASSGKPLPLSGRLQFVLDGFDRPAVAWSAQGALLGTNSAARLDVGHFEQFSRPDFLSARASALREGHGDVALDSRHWALHRIGSGHDVAVVVLMPEQEAPAARLDSAETSALDTTARDEPLDESFADEVLVDEDDTVDEAATISTDNPPPPADAPAAPAAVAAAVAPATAAASGVEPVAAEIPEPHEIVQARHSLRFIWQMDAETRFSLGSDEFSKLIGPIAAAALGRPWNEIVDHLGIDPEQKIAKAVASRETWSGIVVDWPVNEMNDRMPIEMSGLPMFDRARNFAGYRGFGICRDMAGLDRLAEMRRQEHQFGTVHPAPAASRESASLESSSASAPEQRSTTGLADETVAITPSDDVLTGEPPNADPIAASAPSQGVAQSADAAAPPQNVVPFPLANDTRTPALSAVENHAFDEIARRLSSRLDQSVRDGTSFEHDEPHHAEDGGTRSCCRRAGCAGPGNLRPCSALQPRRRARARMTNHCSTAFRSAS